MLLRLRNIPYPVLSDLLFLLSNFITKGSLGDIAYNVYFKTSGATNVLQQLTINVIKYFNASFVGPQGGNFVMTPVVAKAPYQIGLCIMTFFLAIAIDRTMERICPNRAREDEFQLWILDIYFCRFSDVCLRADNCARWILTGGTSRKCPISWPTLQPQYSSQPLSSSSLASSGWTITIGMMSCYA